MSSDLQPEPDESAGAFPDVSLGSFDSSSSFHSLPRVEQQPPSVSSLSTAPSSATLSTPSPSRPRPTIFPRRKGDEPTPIATHRTYVGDNQEGDDIEGKEDPVTPVALRAKRVPFGTATSKSAVNLTLRDQEKVIDSLKKENFSLKLKVHFLEERLNQLAPEHVETAFKQNINLKIEVQARGVELKKYKKLCLEMERDLQAAQKDAGGTRAREREVEQVLEDRERELRELRRRRAVGPEDGALREVEARNADLEKRQAELEDEVDDLKAIIDENREEITHLNDLVREGNQSVVSDAGEGRRARLELNLTRLEEENEDLRIRHEEDMRIMREQEDDREALGDELERMKLALADLERRREAESLERSESRAQMFEEREEREAMEDNLNAVRDQLAATTIELQQREDELEMRSQELNDVIADHKQEVAEIQQGWREEVEEARAQNDELRDVIAGRDAENRELRGQLEEQGEGIREERANFEAAAEHMERESEMKEDELRGVNIELEDMGRRVWELEDEVERFRDENERIKEEAAAEKEASESIVAALKEKLSSAKEQLQEMTSLYEECRQEVFAHREREEELGRHAGELAAEVEAQRASRDADLESLQRQREDDARKYRRALDEKESEIRNSRDDLSRQIALVSEREKDLAALQTALKSLEVETRRVGESHTNDKFSLELELDRFKRDVVRLEDELSRARAALADQEAKTRDRDEQLDRLHDANRDFTTSIAAQTQARLNVTEKLDSAQSELKRSAAELTTSRARANDLEQRLSNNQRSMLSTEQQFNHQLTERNALLMDVHQRIQNILSGESASKSAQEPRPYTNFRVFHEILLTKLEALCDIQGHFDKRSKETEVHFAQKLNEIKRQLDYRWKQIDGFEMKVKSALENKQSWRRKYLAKESELESIKASNSELHSQLAHVKGTPNSKDSEIRALTARNTNNERRLVNSQNQLASSEERNAYLVDKHQAEKNQWEARVKEYESRLRAADEKVKRERQGGKERVTELENHVKTLSKQVDLAKQRNPQLSEIIDKNKPTSAGR